MGTLTEVGFMLVNAKYRETVKFKSKVLTWNAGLDQVWTLLGLSTFERIRTEFNWIINSQKEAPVRINDSESVTDLANSLNNWRSLSDERWKVFKILKEVQLPSFNLLGLQWPGWLRIYINIYERLHIEMIPVSLRIES